MSARQASLLFVIGSDEQAGVTADGRPKYAGCTDLHRLFDKREPVHVLRLNRHALRQRRRPELGPYRAILNLITDPDQNPKTLDNLKKLLRGYRGQVLNPPEAVTRTTRDQIARRLAGTPGLVVPKVVRLFDAKPDVAARAIARAGLHFPLIVRKAGTHTGVIVGLFETVDELKSALTEQGEYVITEFVDFRSGDGIYRKYRSFFIGGRVIFRHLLASDRWSVHAKDRQRFMVDRANLVEEERALFERPEGAFASTIMDTLYAVRDRMKLDYFGMDFGIAADGQPVLFEANATMNFLPFLADPRLEHVKQCFRPASEAFHAMLGCIRPGSIGFDQALAAAQ